MSTPQPQQTGAAAPQQQGETSSATQHQQGQTTTPRQQGAGIVFRDWASI